MKRETWKTFRDEGMLWWLNRILHTFGWSIVVEVDENDKAAGDVYPARTTWMGFSPEANEKRLQEFREGLMETTPVAPRLQAPLLSPSLTKCVHTFDDGGTDGHPMCTQCMVRET